jgi:hypothetical protein
MVDKTYSSEGTHAATVKTVRPEFFADAVARGDVYTRKHLISGWGPELALAGQLLRSASLPASNSDSYPNLNVCIWS